MIINEFNKLKRRVPWYPGSREKYERFKNKFPNATACGQITCKSNMTLKL